MEKKTCRAVSSGEPNTVASGVFLHQTERQNTNSYFSNCNSPLYWLLFTLQDQNWSAEEQKSLFAQNISLPNEHREG